jgi:hypothetical protein
MAEPLQRSGSSTSVNEVDTEDLSTANQLIKVIHGLSQLQASRCLAEIHLITLDRIEGMLGATWARLRTRILPMVQRWIEAELDGGDSVVGLGDGFCILYARLRGREAEAATEALERLVSARLFGTEGGGGKGTARAKEEPVSVLMDAQATEGAQAHLSEVAEAGKEDVTPHYASPRERLQQIEVDQKKPEIRDSYLPLWSASRQSVNVFSCVPHRLPGHRSHYYDPPEDGPDIDRALLNRALENILELHAAGENCFLVVSFNFNSINRQRNRRPYELMLREIPKELRSLFISRIVRLPPGTPSMSVPPAVAFLRTFFQRVFVHVSLGEHDLSAYGGGGLGGVGISLRAKGMDNKPVDPQGLARFVLLAKRFRMPAYVEGIATPTELAACREAGFDLFGGGLISQPLKKPVRAYRLSEETILSRRGGGEWVIE